VKANLNGTLLPVEDARLPAQDHGVLYGDGLFETLRVYGGRFFRLSAHLERLRLGAAQIALQLPWTDGVLIAALEATGAANGFGDGVLRLTVTRGAGPALPVLDGCGPPNYLITARGLNPQAGSPVSACFAGRHPQASSPAIKSISYQPFVLARAEARQRGFDEALLTVDDTVVESSTGNLFAVIGGRLITPPLDSGCLAGITRAAVLEIAESALGSKGKPLSVEERTGSVRKRDLLRADEVFLTNSVSGIQPVVRLEDHTYRMAPGALTGLLQRLYRELVARETAG